MFIFSTSQGSVENGADPFFMLALLVIIPAAKSQRLALDLSNDEVAISTGLRVQLLLFGATEGTAILWLPLLGRGPIRWFGERETGGILGQRRFDYIPKPRLPITGSQPPGRSKR